MSRPSAPRCPVCGDPFRKGQIVVMTTFARYAGRSEEGICFSPYLTAIRHLDHPGGELSAEAIREARRAGRGALRMTNDTTGESDHA